ncbi:glycosyltransferase family 4 protein [Candidatus Pacearchaeota archaeon]|nr:glycosyltransferase family 4 protein [Candidatus Pacearchaeota archaeon]
MVCNHFYPVVGGEENHIYNLAKGLIEKGHIVQVYTSNKTYQREILPAIDMRDNIAIKRFSGKLSLFRAILRTKCDIVHYHHYRSPFIDFGIIAGKLSKKKTVFTLHCVYPSKNFFNGIVKKTYDLSLGKISLTFVDKIIALTENDKRDAIKLGTNPTKIKIVPNCILFEKFKVLEKPALFNEKFGINRFILYVGRLDWNKGVKYVVQAMPDIMKDYPDMKFVIIGEDVGYKKEIENEIERLNIRKSVMFLGRINNKELLSAYAACSVLVCPSAYEGLPTVILEAMAYKRPVIATRTGGTSYVIKDGYNGYLVDFADPKGIYKAVIKAVGNKEVGENARREVEVKYTWEKAILQIEQTYETLLNTEL